MKVGDAAPCAPRSFGSSVRQTESKVWISCSARDQNPTPSTQERRLMRSFPSVMRLPVRRHEPNGRIVRRSKNDKCDPGPIRP